MPRDRKSLKQFQSEYTLPDSDSEPSGSELAIESALPEIEALNYMTRIDRHFLEHNADTERGFRFLNPYTFFPIEHKIVDRKPRGDSPDYQGYTGYLICSLVVDEYSPLFIPNTTKTFGSNTKDHKMYEFFSYDNLFKETAYPASEPERPIIPGSELRGMARSIYEQLTNSCLLIIDEDNYPHKRTPTPKTPYIMKCEAGADGKEVWKLYENPNVYKYGKKHDTMQVDRSVRTATKYEVPSEEEIDINKDQYKKFIIPDFSADTDGYFIHKLSRDFSKKGADPRTITLHATGLFETKHLTFFEEDSGVLSGETLSGTPLERFELVMDSYTKYGAASGAYKEYRERYRQKKPILVYADDTLQYFSPACITQEYFITTIDKLLEMQDKHQSCKGPDFCPACKLFGAIGDGENIAIGSRVRFADAYSTGEVEFTSPKTLAPLSSPKISSTEFYLRKPVGSGLDIMTWNYDYYATKGKGKYDPPIRHLYQAEISGRKVYWHHPFDYGAAPAQTNQNITARLLKSGKFEFKVYFEDVSSRELRDLIYAIGGREGRFQKLGHGKPLGLGSVFVKVDELKLFSYEIDSTSEGKIIHRVPLDVSINLPADDPATTSRKSLIEFFAERLDAGTVRYPTPYRVDPPKGTNKIYEWFRNNKDKLKDINNPTIDQTMYIETL